MDDPQPGPSRANPAQRNVFQLFEDNISDEEDDFPIPHQSDESGESSDEDSVDLDLDAVDIDWREVKPENEVDLDLNVPTFTQRGSKSPRNIPGGCQDPIDFFSLFFDNDILATIVTNSNAYATDFLNKPATLAWLQNHPKSRYTKWPEDGITIVDLRKYLGL